MTNFTEKLYLLIKESTELQKLASSAKSPVMLQDDFVFLLPKNFKGVSFNQVDWKELYSRLQKMAVSQNVDTK